MSERTLPPGWVETTIGEISNVTSGIGFPKEYQGKATGKIGFFKVGDVSRAVLDNHGILETAEHYVSKDVMALLHGKLIPRGSTVFAKIGEAIHLNRRAYVKDDCLIDNNVMSVKAVLNEMDLFLFHYFNSISFSDLSRSTTVPSLRKSDIDELIFPLPPLAEQKRIADKLDSLLAELATCRAHLDRVPETLARFRQSVLAAATSGRLTEDWRKKHGVEEEWDATLLGDHVEDVSYGTAAKSRKSGKVPVLRMGNIQNGRINWTDLVYSSDDNEIEKYKLSMNDVLFNRTNSPELVGKAAIYKSEYPAIYAGYLIRIKCANELNPDFLNYCLGSPYGRDYCWSVKSDGVSQSNINAAKLREFPLSLPSLPEQAEIVKRVEALFAEADSIEERYKAARERVDSLEPALLAKAFRGELVAQDPADESASVLLERIKTARENAGSESARKPRAKTEELVAAESGAEYAAAQKKPGRKRSALEG